MNRGLSGRLSAQVEANPSLYDEIAAALAAEIASSIDEEVMIELMTYDAASKGAFFFRCNGHILMDGVRLADGPQEWLDGNAPGEYHAEYRMLDGRPIGCFLTFVSPEKAALFKLFWL